MYLLHFCILGSAQTHHNAVEKQVNPLPSSIGLRTDKLCGNGQRGVSQQALWGFHSGYPRSYSDARQYCHVKVNNRGEEACEWT